MKNLLMAAAIASLAGAASADVYMDSTGDLAGTFAGFDHMDIASVEITNDATWLYIDISVVAMSADWGKYLVAMDVAGAGDGTGGWTRNIDWGTADYFIGSWADSGTGGELHAYAAGWSMVDATWAAGTEIQTSGADHGIGVHHIAVTLASLGLSVGDTFGFDVASTGENDPNGGVDHLSIAGESTPGWDDGSVAGQFLTYTVVPAPSSLALVGLGGLLAGRRRR